MLSQKNLAPVYFPFKGANLNNDFNNLTSNQYWGPKRRFIFEFYLFTNRFVSKNCKGIFFCRIF